MTAQVVDIKDLRGDVSLAGSEITRNLKIVPVGMTANNQTLHVDNGRVGFFAQEEASEEEQGFPIAEGETLALKDAATATVRGTSKIPAPKVARLLIEELSRGGFRLGVSKETKEEADQWLSRYSRSRLANKERLLGNRRILLRKARRILRLLNASQRDAIYTEVYFQQGLIRALPAKAAKLQQSRPRQRHPNAYAALKKEQAVIVPVQEVVSVQSLAPALPTQATRGNYASLTRQSATVVTVETPQPEGRKKKKEAYRPVFGRKSLFAWYVLNAA